MGFYSSFVVRIWVDDDLKMQRGHVQHVGTQESISFLTLDKMHAFMMNHLNSPPVDPRWQRGGSRSGMTQWDVSDEQVR